MIPVRTAAADRWKGSPMDDRRAAPIPQKTRTDGELRDWCESRAHPRGRVCDGECICGLIRYDD
jgi:hypothetical protein